MAAPAWNPSDPTVYENPTTHDVYQVADATGDGQWHVYQTHAEYVWAAIPGKGFTDIVNVTPAQYAAEQAPVAAPPAPAPPPSAPSTPTTPNPQPNPSVLASLDATAEEIKSEIFSIDAAASPQDVELIEKVTDSKIMQLQNQIYQAYQTGNLTQSQMQDMEASTITMSEQAMSDQVLALQKQAAQGSLVASDQTTAEEQLQVFSANVQELTARGAISPESELQFNTSVSNLEGKLQSLTVGSSSSTGGTTPPSTPIGSSGGGGSASSGGNGNNPSNGGSPGSGSSGSGGATGTTDGGDSTPSQIGSVSTTATPSPSSSGGATTATPSPASGASYTVVHGDTMWGIAQANGISLSQLESLNPQIANPRVIVPGETINLGSGGTGDSGSSSSGSSSAASGSGSTYTVVHGDTLSGIAAANGMTTSQIEALNPQFKDPDLIFPGQSVNLGGGGTGAAADPTQAVVSQTQATSPSSSTGTSTDSNNDSSDGGISSDSSSSGGGAIGFPEKSSYPFGTIGSEAEKALSGITPTAQAAGWVSGAESESSDIAKQVFEAGANQSSTDPLKINEDKSESSGH